jgi:hypothetical protein
MLDHWFEWGESELPCGIGEMRRETDERLGTWNRQGRALCSAFLDAAGGQRSIGNAGSRDHSCHEPT